MGSVTSEEDEKGPVEEEYFVCSADVSESESLSAGGGTYADHSASSPASSSSTQSAVCSATTAVAKLTIPGVAGRDALVCKPERSEIDISEVEMMKERFAKLLLGEDMSGGGKGVCTALAISNAITNLSATVFGELWRLEPLVPQKKSMWRREMECLLCVSDYIVELNPALQDFPGGGTYEIMVSRPRSDLHINLPALKKLDAMLIGVLDGFQETEFWYVDRGILYADSDEIGSYHPSSSCHGRPSMRQEDKWWLPYPCVPPKGLCDETRKRMLHCRDCVHQILKAAIAINSSVLIEMEIPDAYYESLPKRGKACVGDIIYHYITAKQFSPEYLLDCLDLSSEHQTLEIANRVEGAVHVWNQKYHKIHPNRKRSRKPSWTGKVKGLVSDAEKSQLLAHRAECLLQSLKIRYPSLPQTLLDMNKIQYNKDVGQSILESYSRVMESLAFNIMARIDDVIYVDDAARRCAVESVSLFSRGGFGGLPLQKKMSPSLFLMQNSPYSSPFPTPAFCSSPVVTSPKNSQQVLGKGNLLVKKNGTEAERVWSYTGILNTRRDFGDTPERD